MTDASAAGSAGAAGAGGTGAGPDAALEGGAGARGDGDAGVRADGAVGGNGGIQDAAAPTDSSADAAGMVDASRDAAPMGEAAAEASGCTFPSLGILRLGDATSPYVLSRLWELQQDIAALGRRTASVFRFLVESGALPNCATGSYDGTQGVYAAGRTAQVTVTDCNTAAVVETFQMTLLKDGLLETPPTYGSTHRRQFEIEVTLSGTLALGPVVLPYTGHFTLSYSYLMTGAYHLSVQRLATTTTLTAAGSGPGFVVGDGITPPVELELGRILESADVPASLAPFWFQEFEYSFVDQATGSSLLIQTPSAVQGIGFTGNGVPRGMTSARDSEGTLASLQLPDFIAANVFVEYATSKPVFTLNTTYAAITSGVPWRGGVDSCTQPPWWGTP
jgi:hypothetical protein